MKSCDLLVVGAAGIGALSVLGGRVGDAGPERELRRRWKARRVLDAGGRLVTPGLVDPHTHAVFAGDRALEFEMRSQGRTYQDIAEAGGGILSTVRATRKASDRELAEGLRVRLDRMLENGTTTAEVKSGYGLTLKDEIRILKVIRGMRHPIRLVPTFLGAHALPPEFRKDRKGYLDLVCDRMLPAAAPLARFCDVFVDRGAFTLEEGKRVLKAARALGLGLKIHAEEFERTGAAAMAASLGAVSADHLMRVNASDIRALAGSGTVAVCLPVTTLFVGEPAYAPARRMLEAGCRVAITTDLNPGSSHAYSMTLAMSMAVLGLKMTPAEALAAATIHAARAIGMDREVGSLEIGKRADFVVWEATSLLQLPYTMGTNLVREVWIGGQRRVSRALR